jgi:dTDP-4-amino-4,6-dideoxygalactose transaminase
MEKEKFYGYYDGAFAVIDAICTPLLGERQAKQGSEVIVTGISCEMFFPALHYRGIVPVFVDVNLDTFLPDLNIIETCIVEGKTKAIIFSYPLGNGIDIEKLKDVCDEYNIFLLEMSSGAGVFGYGDVGLSKNGDGYDVQVRSNPILYNSIKANKEKLYIQYGRFPISWQYLFDSLKGHKKYFRLQLTQSQPDWFGFSLTVKESAPFDRYELSNYLKENGIQVRFIDSATLLSQPSFKNVRHSIFQDLVNSDVIMQDTIWLPLKQNRKQEIIVKLIDEFVRSKNG